MPAPRGTQPQAQPTPAAAQAPTRRADRANLTVNVNPYGSAETVKVAVDGWKKGPNDSIEHILRNQGYSMNDIYRKDSNGHTLIERVAQANGLKDPNLLRPVGRELTVPVKAQRPQPKPQVEQPPAEQPKPQVEQPKPPVEQPKPQVEQPAPVQPNAEQPKPNAEQPSPTTEQPAPEAQPRKRRHFRLWPFGHRHHRDDQPVNPTPRPETNPTPAPANDGNGNPTPVQPEPNGNTTSPALPENAGSEVSLLIQGVNDKKFTRAEFQALNATANQFTELQARYSKEGVTPDEMKQLAQVQQQYGQMYARFLADDNAKIRFSGADSQNPDAQFRAGQNDAGGSLYDDYSANRISQDRLSAALLNQRNDSATRGSR